MRDLCKTAVVTNDPITFFHGTDSMYLRLNQKIGKCADGGMNPLLSRMPQTLSSIKIHVNAPDGHELSFSTNVLLLSPTVIHQICQNSLSAMSHFHPVIYCRMVHVLGQKKALHTWEQCKLSIPSSGQIKRSCDWTFGFFYH